MDFEDSRNALFPEPNAYIQRCDRDECHPKKVVFQEPYENLPRFYIDNDFKKGHCDCVPKKKPHDNHHEHDNCTPPPAPHGNNAPQFDFKSMMPLLSGLMGKGGGNMSSLMSMFTQNNSNANSTGFDMSNIISTVASNPSMMSGIMNMFKGGGLGGLFNKKSSPKVEMKSTDICIKNYTRVD